MEPYLAQIIMFGGNFAPRSWAYCDGQILPINSNQALFSLLGTTYGGDGRTTFALPDMRGRIAVHAGQGPGLSNRSLGSKGGSEQNILNTNQMPAHTHTATGVVKAKNGPGDESNPGGGFPATAGSDMYAETSNTNMAADSVTVTVQNTGASQPINNLEPFQVVHYIICVNGLFPSRN